MTEHETFSLRTSASALATRSPRKLAALAPISFLLTLVIETVVHEFFHALAAVLVGLPLRRIVIGRGSVLFRKKIGDCVLELRSLPQSGSVHVVPSLQSRPFAMFAFIAAGPSSSFGLLAVVILIGQHITTNELGNALILPAVFALLLSLLFNLWPHRVNSGGLRLANDGLALLQLPWAGSRMMPYRKGFDAQLSRYLLPGEELPALSGNSDKIAWCMIRRHLPPLTTFAECRSSIEHLLSRDLARCERVALLDVLVSEGLAEGDVGLAADLDRWSEEAYSLAPAIATVVASRGSVLVDTGRALDGLAMLRDAEDGHAGNDCLVHAFRALGHFKLANIAQAHEELSRSKTLFETETRQSELVGRTVERIATTIGAVFDPGPGLPEDRPKHVRGGDDKSTNELELR